MSSDERPIDTTAWEEALTALAVDARPRPDCPPPERLWEAAAGEGTAEERREVIGHTVTCQVCAEAWRIAIEMGAAPEAVAAPELPTAAEVAAVTGTDDEDEDTVAFPIPAPAQSETAPEPEQSGEMAKVLPFWRRAGRPLALAAGIVLALGMVLIVGLPGDPDQPALRGGEDAIAALVDGPLPRQDARLAWSAGPPGTRYDLVVTTGALEPVLSVRGLAESELTLPAERLAALPAGSTLLWRVDAQLPDGSRRSSATFSTALE